MRNLTFSIIIPTFGRQQALSACLQALARLDAARDACEVIVVNDGGSWDAPALAAAWSGQLNLRLLAQSHAGPAAARNLGGRHAQGNFLAFVDDDCQADPGWLAALTAQLAAMPDHLVGGRTVNALADNRFAATSQAIVSYLYAHYNADPTRARFLASNNLAVSARRFRQRGGFDTAFPWAAGEDREFCARWLAHGGGMIYAPQAIVYHTQALTARSFWQQQFNYGRGARRLRRRVDLAPAAESWAFYVGLLGLRGSQMPVATARPLLLFAQLAHAAGFLVELGRAAES
ncbi:MAG: glycosyltransferase [Anaerolineae bacterium]